MINIKNIIFDLGGVLLNIDYNKTVEAFEAIGYKNFSETFSHYKASPLVQGFETGKVTEEVFFTGLKKIANFTVTNEQLIAAWNAMLFDFRTESLKQLEKLAVNYKLYLLSNTNETHYNSFKKIAIRDTGVKDIDEYFTKAYYSHHIGLRKPYAEAYNFVLNNANLAAEETLFIDDLLPNTEAADKLGIKTHLLLPDETVETLDWDKLLQG